MNNLTTEELLDIWDLEGEERLSYVLNISNDRFNELLNEYSAETGKHPDDDIDDIIMMIIENISE